VKQRLLALRDDMSRDLALARKSQLIRSGVHVTVLGRTNAGKSSVINRLARREVSIVSPVRGTTRDVVRARVEIAGLAVDLCDTAGLNAASADPLELEGIRRTRDLHQHETDLALALVDFDPTAPSLLAPHGDTLDMVVAHNRRTILVFNKLDLVATKFSREEVLQRIAYELPDSLKTAPRVLVSCATGEGLDTLMALVEEHVTALYTAGDAAENQSPIVTRDRHRRELEQCVTCLTAFIGTHVILSARLTS
jgi:tRNA modification GTPase